MFKLLLAAGVALSVPSPVQEPQEEDDTSYNVDITGILNNEEDFVDAEETDEDFLKLV